MVPRIAREDVVSSNLHALEKGGELSDGAPELLRYVAGGIGRS